MFKKGDVIVCYIGYEGCLTVGKEYTVDKGQQGTVVRITDDSGMLLYYPADNFTLKTPYMSNELKIDKARVLAEAEKCSTFKNIAKGLWPEVFEEEERITDRENVILKTYPFAVSIRTKDDSHDLITIYDSSQGYRGFVLNSLYNWVIESDFPDYTGSLLLIPTRK